MINKFARGVVEFVNTTKYYGFLVNTSGKKVFFHLDEGRCPQIQYHHMYYVEPKQELPVPRVGDFLIYEEMDAPEGLKAERWGFQRMFFLEIWNFERKWAEAYRALVDKIHHQHDEDINRDIEEQFDSYQDGDPALFECTFCRLPSDSCECPDPAGLDEEPHQAWFTESPMGHHGYE